MKGIIAGVIAGLVGALIWAVIAALTGFEIGWIAWGIGAAVGAAVAWGAKCNTGFGVAAVIITIVAIVGGKYSTVEIVLGKEIKATNQEVALIIQDDDYIISLIVDERIGDIMEQGEKIEWPEGVNPENISSKEDYPAKIWAAAEESWNGGTDKQKEEYRKAIQDQIESDIKMFKTEARKAGFVESFGVIDIIFFFIAIGTAYKIAAKGDDIQA